MKFKSIYGEEKLADTSQLSNFGNIIDEKMKLYDAKDIWNCDDTGLQCKNPPTKSYVTSIDDYMGTKARKEQVTILLCCSLFGENMHRLLLVNRNHLDV